MSSYIDTNKDSIKEYPFLGKTIIDADTLKSILLREDITKIKIYENDKTKIFVALEDETNKIIGEWKDIYNGFGTCSICDYRNVVDNYCPNCGAKIRGKN
jgi:hypothetical protein